MREKGFVTMLTTLIVVMGLVVTVYLMQSKQTLFSEASAPSSNSQKVLVDLKTYYPNDGMITSYYLIQNSPQQVLWFERQDQWSVKMYNSSPTDQNSRCHFDLLSWWDDGTLRYSQTHDECLSKAVSDTTFDPPIIFLPRSWDPRSGKWELANSTKVTQKENNEIVCTGTNNYKATIFGWEKNMLHWQTRQTTTWDNFGKCSGWQPTEWQEDYWLTDSMPKEDGGTAKGLSRSKGGNLSTTSGNWDITFNKWAKLPTTSTPTPAPQNDCCSNLQKQRGYQCIKDCGGSATGFSCLSPKQITDRNLNGCPI